MPSPVALAGKLRAITEACDRAAYAVARAEGPGPNGALPHVEEARQELDLFVAGEVDRVRADLSDLAATLQRQIRDAREEAGGEALYP